MSERKPDQERRPYHRPKVKSSDILERAAAGCSAVSTAFPCNGTS